MRKVLSMAKIELGFATNFYFLFILAQMKGTLHCNENMEQSNLNEEEARGPGCMEVALFPKYSGVEKRYGHFKCWSCLKCPYLFSTPLDPSIDHRDFNKFNMNEILALENLLTTSSALRPSIA
jgi:hypothetical protein